MPTPGSLPPGALPAFDPDGHEVIDRTDLGNAAAGGISVAAGLTDFLVSSVPAGAHDVQFLQYLRLVCTVGASADGLLSFKDQGGGTVLLSIPIAATYAAGQILEYQFAVPLRSVAHLAFAVDTPVNTGTWFWFLNGFVMNSTVLA